jgi:hypothetical protein
VTSRNALAGYLLEELIAKLVQNAGYRLLTNQWQDPNDLSTNRSGDLLVKGRGANHQVDVLGEFTVVPPFSQPLRLFVEAKATKPAIGLPIIRNAVGTITDVNEAWMINYSTNRVRRHYRYALFSTGGFTLPAQEYALAHQISLIDLSGPEWSDLRDIAREGAEEVLALNRGRVKAIPLRNVREALRDALHTGTDFSPQNGPLDEDLLLVAEILNQRLEEAIGGALLAFPVGQQVLLARPDNLNLFLERATRDPEHQVRMTVEREQSKTRARTWVVRPISNYQNSYTLRLTLPAAIEAQALAESDRRSQVMSAKSELGGQLDIFWDPRPFDNSAFPGPRLFRLLFAGRELRERRLDG